MALQFKRTRLDAAHQRSFPNSKEEVIFRNDVSNKNLLQNPFRTSGIPVGPVGVQNRPVNPMVDDRGAMYGGSVSVLRKGISNSTLLHNPYRFKTDPIDDPRTLTRQVINDINTGKAPQYIRENKGIDEIAFMIVKALPDNGVKLATLSMLKSYITGMRLQSVLDQGGQNVTKAFDVLNQLVVSCKSLYRAGMLGIKLPALLLQYSENIAKIFGDTVLQPVSPILMFTAIQDLASVSSILTKLFRSQNSVSPPTNVSIDEWAKAEAAKIQALRLQQEQQIPPPPTPQVNATGDNQPTGTEGIKDADNIKQGGTGRMSKKKKIPKIGGGLSVNWGIANPKSAQSLIEEPSNSVTPLPPSNFQPPPNIINVMPVKDPVNVNIVEKKQSGWQTAADVLSAGIPIALGAFNVYSAVMDRSSAAERDRREQERDDRDASRYKFEKEKLEEEKARKDRDKEENDRYISEDISNILQLNPTNKKFYNKVFGTRQILYDDILGHGLNVGDLERIMKTALSLNGRRNVLQNILLEYQARGEPLGSDRPRFAEEVREARPASQYTSQPAQLGETTSHFAARAPRQSAEGKKRKSQKNIKSKIKKSKNLDAQILALLRA